MALIQRFQLARKYAAAGCPSPWRWAGTALRRDDALLSKHTGGTLLPPIRAEATAKPPMAGCNCIDCQAVKAGRVPIFGMHDPVYLEDEGSPTRFAGAP